MKKIFIPTVLAFSIFIASCNSNKEKTDSQEVVTEVDGTKQDSTSTNTGNDGQDASFALAAADGGMLEVKLGQLAQTNGSSAKVKELGKMMETDHGKAGEELKSWAAKNNVSLPAALSQEKQDKYNSLAAKKGAEFDKAYAADMVEDHEKDIAEFKKEADGGKNAELKAWATGKLPVLQHHLEMSKMTNDGLKK